MLNNALVEIRKATASGEPCHVCEGDGARYAPAANEIRCLGYAVPVCEHEEHLGVVLSMVVTYATSARHAAERVKPCQCGACTAGRPGCFVVAVNDPSHTLRQDAERLARARVAASAPRECVAAVADNVSLQVAS